LTTEQEKVIIAIITEKSPNDVGFREYLWTRKLCAELVKQQFGIEMPLSTMGHYLARWGFTSQRPKKKVTNKGTIQNPPAKMASGVPLTACRIAS
jgi:transposase